jgi:AcrR family transcriptional regulator
LTLEQIENLGRPLRADAERNRRRILVAAAEVFAKRGLDAGLDEIAGHAGVGTGTVYRRFPDKSVLIDALFESRITAIVALAESALELPDPWDGLTRFLENSIEMQLADRGLKELLFGEACGSALGATGSARFTAKLDALIPLLTALVDRAKAAGRMRSDVSVTDLVVIQFMLHGVGMFSSSVEPELWRRQLGILLDGLRAERDTATPLPLVPLTVPQLQAICMPGPTATAVHHHHHRPPQEPGPGR